MLRMVDAVVSTWAKLHMSKGHCIGTAGWAWSSIIAKKNKVFIISVSHHFIFDNLRHWKVLLVFCPTISAIASFFFLILFKHLHFSGERDFPNRKVIYLQFLKLYDKDPKSRVFFT